MHALDFDGAQRSCFEAMLVGVGFCLVGTALAPTVVFVGSKILKAPRSASGSTARRPHALVPLGRMCCCYIHGIASSGTTLA